jgi:hypothetical protein
VVVAFVHRAAFGPPHQPLGCLAPNRLVALKESLAPYPIPKRGVLLLKLLWVATGGHLAGPKPLLLDFHQVHPLGLLLGLQVGLIFAVNHSRVNFSFVFSSSSSSSTFAYISEQRLPLLFFSTHNQDGAVGMTDDRIGDTAHQSPPDPAQTSAAYHHESCAQLLRQVDYLRGCLPRP